MWLMPSPRVETALGTPLPRGPPLICRGRQMIDVPESDSDPQEAIRRMRTSLSSETWTVAHSTLVMRCQQRIAKVAPCICLTAHPVSQMDVCRHFSTTFDGETVDSLLRGARGGRSENGGFSAMQGELPHSIMSARSVRACFILVQSIPRGSCAGPLGCPSRGLGHGCLYIPDRLW